METEVFINNSKINDKIDEKKTLGEVIALILDSVISKEDLITSIEVNGKTLSNDEEGKKLNETIDKFNNINFNVKSNLDIVFEVLDSCSSYIDLIILKTKKIVMLYQKGEIEQGNNKFLETMEVLDFFIQMVSKIHKTLKLYHAKTFFPNKLVHELEIHLFSVLKALLMAKKKEDIVVLCDLLEYELVDNLTQWKIKLIPKMKRLKNHNVLESMKTFGFKRGQF